MAGSGDVPTRSILPSRIDTTPLAIVFPVPSMTCRARTEMLGLFGWSVATLTAARTMKTVFIALPLYFFTTSAALFSSSADCSVMFFRRSG